MVPLTSSTRGLAIDNLESRAGGRSASFNVLLPAVILCISVDVVVIAVPRQRDNFTARRTIAERLGDESRSQRVRSEARGVDTNGGDASLHHVVDGLPGERRIADRSVLCDGTEHRRCRQECADLQQGLQADVVIRTAFTDDSYEQTRDRLEHRILSELRMSVELRFQGPDDAIEPLADQYLPDLALDAPTSRRLLSLIAHDE